MPSITLLITPLARLSVKNNLEEVSVKSAVVLEVNQESAEELEKDETPKEEVETKS